MCIELVNHAGYGKKILHKTISRPLREERKSEYDAQSAAVTRGLDQREPSNVGCDVSIKSEGGLDFPRTQTELEGRSLSNDISKTLIDGRKDALVSIGVVVSQCIQSLVLTWKELLICLQYDDIVH